MDTLTRILPFLLVATLGSGLRIETVSREYDQTVGTDITLECVLDGPHSGMQNPLSWHKTQGSKDIDGLKVSNNMVVEPPFDAGDRIKTTYGEKDGKPYYNLHIKQLTKADSGKYRCVIESGTGVLAHIIHTLNVIAPVESVEIVGQPTPLVDNETISYVPEIHYFLGKKGGYLACTAIGGYPKPRITVKMGNETFKKVITLDLDKIKISEELAGSQVGLQVMKYTVKKWSVDFKAGVDDTQITCEATSHDDLPSATQTVHVSVYSKPDFTRCKRNRFVEEGATLYVIECEFKSFPAFDQVVWTVGDETIPNQRKVKSFQSSVKTETEQANMFVASLVIDEITNDMFETSFTLTVTNKAGNSTTTISLQKGAQQTVNDNGGNGGASSPGATALTVCTLLALLFYCKNEL